MRSFCLLAGLLFTLILVSCEVFQQQENDNLENSQFQSNIENSLEYPTLTATLKPTPTRIPTLTATVTNVPIATLGFDDPAEAIRFLFATNNYCEFPCLWGITPGVTKWVEAEGFFSPLALKIYHRADLKYLEDGYKQHNITFVVPNQYDSDGVGSYTIIEDDLGVVNMISMITNFEEMGFDIFNFLNKYGPPSEVYIYVRGSIAIWIEDEGDYTIVLYYEEDGILIAFDGKTDIVNMMDEFVEICTSRLIHEYAWLKSWDTSHNTSFEELSSPGLNASGVLEYREISEATIFTAVTFFEKATDPNVTDFCFEVENPDFQE